MNNAVTRAEKASAIAQNAAEEAQAVIRELRELHKNNSYESLRRGIKPAAPKSKLTQGSPNKATRLNQLLAREARLKRMQEQHNEAIRRPEANKRAAEAAARVAANAVKAAKVKAAANARAIANARAAANAKTKANEKAKANAKAKMSQVAHEAATEAKRWETIKQNARKAIKAARAPVAMFNVRKARHQANVVNAILNQLINQTASNAARRRWQNAKRRVLEARRRNNSVAGNAVLRNIINNSLRPT